MCAYPNPKEVSDWNKENVKRKGRVRTGLCVSAFLFPSSPSGGHRFPQLPLLYLHFHNIHIFCTFCIFEIDNAFIKDGIPEVEESALSKALAIQAQGPNFYSQNLGKRQVCGSMYL